MSQQLTYPGVYIQEVPSGVRTITGVATSITAFVGRTPRGPVANPTMVTSFADFERRFGQIGSPIPGLAADMPLTYAVRSFFANGGSQALIVRLNDGGTPAELDDGNGFTLVAADPGDWANALTFVIDLATSDPTDTDLFNLTIRGAANAVLEQHPNVSIDEDDARYVVRVLAQASRLLRVQVDNNGDPIVPANQPGAGTTAVTTAGTASNPLQNATITGARANRTGIYALENADIFNIMCIPPDTRDGDTAAAVYDEALDYCVERRAMLIVDPLLAWNDSATAVAGVPGLALTGPRARNAAIYFPRVVQADPLRDGQAATFAPSGLVAGIMARTDSQRGVWKAPAGLDASLNGALRLAVTLNDGDSGTLNQEGVNAFRTFRGAGSVVWGARTMRGADRMTDEYKYIPIRRMTLFIEESLYRGTQWVVFEPNDEPLWAQIRLNVGAFMHNLFRQGAFQGKSPREAYFVKCDSETNPQEQIDLGIVNIHVGFAPLKPAEFVVIRIQQIAQTSAT